MAGVRACNVSFPQRRRPGSKGPLGLGSQDSERDWEPYRQHQPLGGLGEGGKSAGQGSGILIIVTINPTFLWACVTWHRVLSSPPCEREGRAAPLDRLRN